MTEQQRFSGPDGMTQLGLLGMRGWVPHLPAQREGTEWHGAARGCTGIMDAGMGACLCECSL